MRIVAADIGGTHARFAFAEFGGEESIVLGDPAMFRTGDYPDLESSWRAFGDRVGEPLPKALAVAFAGLAGREPYRLTNQDWIFSRDRLRCSLGIEQLIVVNDFAAVAHAVAELGPEHFRHFCGPRKPLPAEGAITVLGPGTGLGVALLYRRGDGGHDVLDTEGGHVDFAPLDATEDAILQSLRDTYGRVSVERLVSGRGLLDIHSALARIVGSEPSFDEEKAIWTAALEESDAMASSALDRFCMILGAVAGDLALAHGADAVVVGGGLGLRLSNLLPHSSFYERFTAKGRYRPHMEQLPVKLIAHPQPGLLGAAVAWAREYRTD